MKVLMVERDRRFSPNSVQRDRDILEQTAMELSRMGHEVSRCAETELTLATTADAVFSMARSEEALDTLAQMESHGTRVINSPSALLRLSRRALLDAADRHHIHVPAHATGDSTMLRPTLPYPLWWKRDDRSSQQADDVLYITGEAEWQHAMSLGAEAYVTESHMEGDLVKFYSVLGTAFIHVNEPQYSKFGKEAVNGHSQGYRIDTGALKQQADTLASAVGLSIYGGDAVIDRQGRACIIDFNDWPSYSSCREAAARAIASLVDTIPHHK